MKFLRAILSLLNIIISNCNFSAALYKISGTLKKLFFFTLISTGYVLSHFTPENVRVDFLLQH